MILYSASYLEGTYYFNKLSAMYCRRNLTKLLISLAEGQERRLEKVRYKRSSESRSGSNGGVKE